MEPESESELSPVQERAVEALCGALTVKNVAEVCGVDRKTIQRWMKQPAFKAALMAARREAATMGTGWLLQHTPNLAGGLMKLVHDPNVPAPARINAMLKIMKFNRETQQFDDINGRLETIEGVLKQAEIYNKLPFP